MDWQNLYQKQLDENLELKKQLDIAESILREYLPIVEDNDEQKLISTMKKASRLMIIGNTEKGDQTTDHYSMMGFTKAYNTARKSCG